MVLAMFIWPRLIIECEDILACGFRAAHTQTATAMSAVSPFLLRGKLLRTAGPRH
jgi:hypothetical protein